jgi:TatD DNase family protein
MELTDTHCHIQSADNSAGERETAELWAKAPELTGDGIIEDAVTAGVTKLICVGCDLEDSKLAVDFAQNHPNCWASIGIHPHEAAKHQSKTKKSHFSHLLENSSLKEGKIVGVGECGLDYFYSHSSKKAQIGVLKFQIELALEHDLPMIFHVREAFDDFWPVFESYKGIRGVLHSFTDSQENLQRALTHNLFIGVNGIATFTKNLAQLEMYKKMPLQKLLLETDAPFLTPAPYRGTINVPKHVRATAEFLAKLQGESLANIANSSTKNAHSLFKLS